MQSSIRFALALLVGCFFLGCGQAPGSGLPPVDAGQQAPSPSVLGALDAIDADAVAAGWALAPALDTAAIEVALYADGDQASGKLLGSVRANLPRGDVNAATKLAGDHGFRFSLPARLKDGVAHPIFAYGVGTDGKVLLGGAPIVFQQAAPVPCASAGPSVAREDGEYEVTLQADNGKFVSAECGGDDLGTITASRDLAAQWETFYLRQQPGGTISLRSSHGRIVSAEGAGGGALHANRKAVGPWELFRLEGSLEEGALIALEAPDGQHWVTARLDLTPAVLEASASQNGPREKLKLHVAYSPFKIRKGIVRAEGRSFVDDDGPFYPLGATLFWSLSGWKTDRARLKANLEFLKSHHYDYVRILGEVDWPGKEIDPNWPDYQQVLGEFIDYAYDKCGLRTELTLVGGKGDAMAIAIKAAVVINAGRQQKILNLEVANESYQRPLTLDQMRAAGRFLRQNTPNLVALSSGEGLNSYVANSTDWRADYVSVYLQPGTANLGTIHMDRAFGDGGWRIARQPWDWKDLPFPISHNEPIGPRSSVAEENDPVRLAMLRAVGLINGVEAFVLHNAAGVTGVVDSSRNRPANLSEVPGIDAVMAAIRGIDAFLPARVGDGQHWNNGWAGSPFNVDAFWSDGADHGVVRNYTVSTADGWVSTEAGIKDRAVFTSSRHALIEVFDVLKGKVKEVELQAGQTLTLTPDSRDSNGLGAFLIVGHYR